MSFERVALIFTVNGTRRVRREVGGIGESARNSATAIDFLKRSMGGLGGALSVRAFVQLSDSATRLNNQLKLVTTGSDNLRRVTSELHKVARETRSGIEPTVELYSRLQRSTEALGLSQQEILQMTKSVNQAFQIFGNTSEEAEAAMVQFSQGLSAGALRGDELRSVLEQSPRLARAIAEGLNEVGDSKLAEAFGQGFKLDDGTFDYKVVLGSLRELGKEGQLTSEKVAAALASQADVLEQEFLQTTATVDQAFILLKNRFLQIFQSEGVQRFVGSVSASLIRLVDNFEDALPAIRVVSTALGVGFAIKAVGAAITATKALTLALLANPIGAIVGAIGLVVGLTLEYGDAVKGIGGTSATLKDEMVGTFRTVWDTAKDGAERLSEAYDSALRTVTSFITGTESGWRDTIARIFGVLKSLVINFIGFISGTFGFIKKFFEDFFGSVSAIFIAIANFGIKFLINPLLIGFKTMVASILSVFALLALGINKAFAGVKNAVIGSVEFLVNKVIDSVNFIIDKINSLPAVEIELLDRKEFDRAEVDIDQYLDFINNSFENASQGIPEIANPVGDGLAKGFTDGFDSGRQTAQEFFDDFNKRNKDNIEKAMNDRLAAEAEAAAKGAGNLTTLNRTGGVSQGGVGEGFANSNNKRSRRNPKEIQDYVRALDQEYATLLKLGQEREVSNEVLSITQRLQRDRARTAIDLAEAQNGDVDLTTAQKDAIKAKNFVKQEEIDLLSQLVERNLQRQEIADAQNDIIDSLTESQREYNVTLEAANELLAQNLITEQERAVLLSETAAAQALRDLDAGIGDPALEKTAALENLRNEEFEKLQIIQNALQARIISETEAEKRLHLIRQQYAAKEKEIQLARKRFNIDAAQNTFGSLTKIAEVWAGKQSGIYKKLFLAEKAFALGRAIIDGVSAIQKAWASAPFPANLPAVAVTTASTGANIAAIVSQTVQGFRDGGQVFGPGTGTSDSILALLSNGEFVVNAESTKKYLPLLQALNTPRFRDGGFVSAVSSPSSPNFSAIAAQPPQNSGGLPPISMEINIDTDGSRDGQRQGEAAAEAAFDRFEQLMDNYVSREQRPGGKLEGTKVNA